MIGSLDIFIIILKFHLNIILYFVFCIWEDAHVAHSLQYPFGGLAGGKIDVDKFSPIQNFILNFLATLAATEVYILGFF